jgi:hypothetical protein
MFSTIVSRCVRYNINRYKVGHIQYCRTRSSSNFVDSVVQAFSPRKKSIVVQQVCQGPVNNLVHNLSFLREFNVDYQNPKFYHTLGHLKGGAFQIKITFDKHGMLVKKEFCDDDIDKIMNQIKIFIEDEIKI